MTPSQYQKLIAARLKAAMAERKITLEELATATGLGLSQIGNYRTGLRLMKPWDAKSISSVLGVRAAYLLGLEESPFTTTRDEERMIRNFRALPERDRARLAAKIDTEAMTYRGDAISDERVGHLSAKGRPQPATKRS